MLLIVNPVSILDWSKSLPRKHVNNMQINIIYIQIWFIIKKNTLQSHVSMIPFIYDMPSVNYQLISSWNLIAHTVYKGNMLCHFYVNLSDYQLCKGKISQFFILQV